MPPTRRRYIQLAGVGLSVGVAGCLSSGSNVTYPSADAAQDPEAAQIDGDAPDADDPDEPDEPAVELRHDVLSDATDSIYDEIRWFEIDYDTTIREYQSTLREALFEIRDLQEILEEDGVITEAELLATTEAVHEIVTDTDEILEPQFTNHFGFRSVNRTYFPRDGSSDIDRFRRRDDWERVEALLDEVESIYAGALTSRELSRRYPDDPIINRLYNRLRGDADTAEATDGRLFELRYISDERRHHPEEPAKDRNEPGYGVYVTAQRNDVMYDPIDWFVRPDIDQTFAPFEDATDRSYRLYIRIHEHSGEANRVNIRQTDSVVIYGQKYADRGAADAALERMLDAKQVEDEHAWGSGGEPWKQVFYDRDGRTIYAYLIRAGAYVFAFGPSRTPWEERDDDWKQLLAGTWFDPN